MDLDKALKGMFSVQNDLRARDKRGINDPSYMSTQMARLAQYTGAVEEKLAELEEEFEVNYAKEMKTRLIEHSMKVTQSEREVDIITAEVKGQIKYLTRLVASAWKQVGVLQSRFNHLTLEASTGKHTI